MIVVKIMAWAYDDIKMATSLLNTGIITSTDNHAKMLKGHRAAGGKCGTKERRHLNTTTPKKRK